MFTIVSAYKFKDYDFGLISFSPLTLSNMGFFMYVESTGE